MLVFLLTISVLAVAGVFFYNDLVKYRQRVSEAWAGVDVHLQERHNLIPNLVEVVKAYASHEKTTFEDVTAKRAESQAASGAVNVASSENDLTGGLARLIAIAEDYPDLKASENFSNLSEELVGIEDKIQYARRYYNGTVRNYNTALETFPSLLVAKLFKFKPSDFFEIKLATQREAPDVSLD